MQQWLYCHLVRGVHRTTVDRLLEYPVFFGPASASTLAVCIQGDLTSTFISLTVVLLLTVTLVVTVLSLPCCSRFECRDPLLLYVIGSDRLRPAVDSGLPDLSFLPFRIVISVSVHSVFLRR
jgi:hypothetical protein